MVSRQLLVAACIFFAGCGGADHVAQMEMQAKEIVRLSTQLQAADERLEIASKQLQASVDHANGVERALEATEKAAEEYKRQAAEDYGRLKMQCEAIKQELASTLQRLAELDRKDRGDMPKLNPIGVWVLDGDPIYRFLFFANGTGVFQRWESDKWRAGDPSRYTGEGEPLLSDGKFIFMAGNADGTFQMHFVRSRKSFSLEPKPGSPANNVVKTKRHEEPVDVTIVMSDIDTARFVGWRAEDAVAKRVEEGWNPRDGNR
jgi:hypothetical protein